MTNNNNTKPSNCACERMTCASFVAGNQCFRCEQVDNRDEPVSPSRMRHAEHGLCGFRDRYDNARTTEHKKQPELHQSGTIRLTTAKRLL